MHYRAFLTSIYLQISKLTFPFIFILLGCKKLEEKCVGDFQILISFRSNSIIYWKFKFLKIFSTKCISNLYWCLWQIVISSYFYFRLVIGRSLYLMLYYLIFLKDAFILHDIIKLYMFCLKLPKYGIFICFLKQIFYNV